MPLHNKPAIAVLALSCVALSACTTVRKTQPTQTAHEQLMLSRAADLASAKIHPNLPQGNAIYVDANNFTDDTEYRTHYAIARIRAQLLTDGYKLVGSADKADTIAEIATGALSIDDSNTLFGLPKTPIPIPFAGTFQTPQIAPYTSEHRTGVAKFLVSFFNAKTHQVQDVVGPIYGFSHDNHSSIFGIGRSYSNVLPPKARAEMHNKKPSKNSD